MINTNKMIEALLYWSSMWWRHSEMYWVTLGR